MDNKFLDMLQEPENLATMLVLGAAIAHAKDQGSSTLGAIAKGGVGAAGFRGGLYAEGEERARTREIHQENVATAQQQRATAQQHADAASQQAASQSREVTVQEGLAPSQGRVNEAQAGYYSRMPAQDRAAEAKYSMELELARDKYWNDYGIELQKGFNEGMKTLAGAGPAELAPLLQQWAGFSWYLSHGKLFEERHGVRPYPAFDKEGRILLGFPGPDGKPRFLNQEGVEVKPPADGTAVVPGPTPAVVEPPAAEPQKPLSLSEALAKIRKDKAEKATREAADKKSREEKRQKVSKTVEEIKALSIEELRELHSTLSSLDEPTQEAVRQEALRRGVVRVK